MTPAFGEHLAYELLAAAGESSAGVSTERSLARFQISRELKDQLAAFDGKRKAMLCISHSAPLGRLVGLKKAEARHADDFNDLESVETSSVDFVVADQVVERLTAGPQALFEQSSRIVRPGGFVIVTTYLIREIHGAPHDYWRISPYGLAQLTRASGLEIALSGAWGSREATNAIQRGFGTLLVEDDSGTLFDLATFNEERHPIVTWAIGRAPG